MPDNFAAALSAEMRRALKQDINTLSDAAMIDFKRNDPDNYNDFMNLVNDLLTFENQHGPQIYEDTFDEHFVVTPRNDPRETIYDVRYNGRPISILFDFMKEANADALVKTARRARFTPTAITFSFDNPTEVEHRPESEYRSDGTFSRDPRDQRFYKPGRWSSDWENAPTLESSPKFSPISDADTTPRTKEFMATLDSRWKLATANAKNNRGEDVTWPMDDYHETALRQRDDAQRAAAKKARRAMEENSNTFMSFIDSLPDPADHGKDDDNHTFDDSAPMWSFDALEDDSTLVTDETEGNSSPASTKSTQTSQDADENNDEAHHITRKDFLSLDDDLADGMGMLRIADGVNAVHAKVKIVDEPKRTLRRVTAKIGPR